MTRGLTIPVLWGLALFSWLACDRPKGPGTPAKRADATAAVVTPADPEAPEVTAAPAKDDGVDSELRAEEREADPRSQTVKLKLAVWPASKGVVLWGRQKLGDFQPGRMTVELVRPRASGPLDLLIRAEGFLPHHVRLFTDRDDRLSVRLHRLSEASALLGGRRPVAPLPDAGP